MSSKTETRLTPGQRLRRGLAYTAAGPVDVTRGAVGLSAHSLAATAAGIRRRYHDGRLRREVVAAQDSIGRELAAAQEIVVGLPQALQDARVKQGRTKRPLVIVVVAAVVLAGGGAAFAIVRRSARPTEPSPRPPSVDFDPKP